MGLLMRRHRIEHLRAAELKREAEEAQRQAGETLEPAPAAEPAKKSNKK